MYQVTCRDCARSYDALTAAECSCLQPVRSFICPSCGNCFCSAGSKALNAFWHAAPAAVWARRKPTAAPQPENAVPSEIRRPMVLFADDDPTSRAIARRVVEALGFGIAIAKTGSEALRMALDYRPELIITDAMMPGLDGREMGRIAKEKLADTRVVIITSVYKDARYKSEAKQKFGADEYLSKPVSPGALREVILKYLNNPLLF